HFPSHGPLRHLPSFPTRRSSDLLKASHARVPNVLTPCAALLMPFDNRETARDVLTTSLVDFPAAFAVSSNDPVPIFLSDCNSLASCVTRRSRDSSVLLSTTKEIETTKSRTATLPPHFGHKKTPTLGVSYGLNVCPHSLQRYVGDKTPINDCQPGMIINNDPKINPSTPKSNVPNVMRAKDSKNKNKLYGRCF